MALPRKHHIPNAFKPHPALGYKPPTPLRNIRRGLIAVVFVLVATVAYVIYWMGMSYYFSQMVKGWVEDRRAQGQLVDFEDYRFSGFPFSFRMDFKKLSFSSSNAKKPWAWRGDNVVAVSTPLRPLSLTVNASGGHSLDITQHGETVTYAGLIGEAIATVPLGGSWPPQGTLALRDLDMSTDGGMRATLRRGVFNIESLGGFGADHKTPTVGFFFDAEGVTVPRSFALPFGNSISRVLLEGQILGFIEKGPAVESLSRWRDDGGVLQISRLSINYAPLILLTAGAVALDAELQPIGSFTAKVEGFFRAVSGLRTAGLIDGKAALTATVVLGAMSKKPKGGGPPTLNLALTVQNRKIYAGPVPLSTVPEISWSDTPAKENVPDG